MIYPSEEANRMFLDVFQILPRSFSSDLPLAYLNVFHRVLIKLFLKKSEQQEPKNKWIDSSFYVFFTPPPTWKESITNYQFLFPYSLLFFVVFYFSLWPFFFLTLFLFLVFFFYKNQHHFLASPAYFFRINCIIERMYKLLL